MDREFTVAGQYDLAANEKGALGEAIVGEVARRVDAPNPIREFVRADLGLDPGAELEIRPNGRTHLQRVAGPDGPLEWRPDYELRVERWTPDGWAEETAYLVEVKTGGYAEFEREQRAVMAELAGRGIDVLAAFVGLDGMPDRFDLRLRKFEGESGETG